jgi:pimeloyl-ACP methyl ester carboxylesterase
MPERIVGSPRSSTSRRWHPMPTKPRKACSRSFPAGRIWLKPDGVGYFAGDLPEAEQKFIWATQAVPVPDLFTQKVEGTAWKTKPSWYIVGKNDRTVHPDLERFVAKRMGATTVELASSHVPMLSQPQAVLDVIHKAAAAVQKA